MPNKDKKASPSLGSPNGVLNRMLNASVGIISKNNDIVKTENQIFSLANTLMSGYAKHE